VNDLDLRKTEYTIYFPAGNIGPCETDAFAAMADVDVFPAIAKACRTDMCGEECVRLIHDLLAEDCMKVSPINHTSFIYSVLPDPSKENCKYIMQQH
jgi:hypothetical protein